jgi:drug/metabolite transporter (DMT)-like permease
MIPAIFATVFFCFSAVSANRATRIAGSVEANFWRLLFATAVLGVWAHGYGGGIGGSAFGIFFVSGVIGFGIGDVALYLAYPRLGSRLTLLLVHCLAAPLAALCEWLYLGTTLTVGEILASSTILFGVGLALVPAENPHIARKDLVFGILFGALAAAGQGLGAVMSRVGYSMNTGNEAGFDGMTVAYQRILGGLLIGMVAFTWVHGVRMLKQRGAVNEGRVGLLPPKKAVRWILMTGLSGPTLGVACYQWALEGTKSGVVLPIVALAPLVVMPLSLWMEGDRPGGRAIVGGVIAVLGVIGLGLVSR